MRKNLQRVWTAWLAKRSHRERSCWTDGDTIYGYDTALLTWDQRHGDLVLNMTRYSVTTTQQRQALAGALAAEGDVYRRVTGLPRGATPADLLAAPSTVPDMPGG